MGERGEDFAFLMLPISALILAVLFRTKRRFVLFDHFVFSMHSLSFLGLLISLSLVSSMAVGGASGLLLLLALPHLFTHMKGTYGTTAAGTFARMTVLFMASSVGFAVLLAVLVFVGIRALPA